MLKEKKRGLKMKKKSDYEEHLKALKVASNITTIDGLPSATVVKETTQCSASHTVIVSELDLAGNSRPRLEDGEMSEDDDATDKGSRSNQLGKSSGGGKDGHKKDKRRKKPHVSYTHAHHKHKKLTNESRLALKKKLKTKLKRKH